MTAKNKIFLFIGPPGSGKGTLAAQCVEQLGWIQLSTGNLCRSHIHKKTDLGKELKAAIDAGQLVSDEIIVAMLRDWLLEHKDTASNIIFDGYPRTKKQAELLYHLLHTMGNFELVVVKFEIAKHLLIDRILSRMVCSNKDCGRAYSLKEYASKGQGPMLCGVCNAVLEKRSDDTREILLQRLDVYDQHEQDIIHFYKDQGHVIHSIDADRPVDEIFADFVSKMKLQQLCQ